MEVSCEILERFGGFFLGGVFLYNIVFALQNFGAI